MHVSERARKSGAPGMTRTCDLLVRSQCFTQIQQVAALLKGAHACEFSLTWSGPRTALGNAAMQVVGILLGIPRPWDHVIEILLTRSGDKSHVESLGTH